MTSRASHGARLAFSALLAWGALASPARAAGAAHDAPTKGPPSAAEVQAARALFTEAIRDEDAGAWDVALEKLHRVADVKLTAGVRYHTALCEEKLGRTATALAHYVEARDAAKAEKNAEVTDLLKEPFLTDLRARVPQLTIHVSADGGAASPSEGAGTAGVEVTIDGRPHPRPLWGVAVPLDPGVHRVEARAPGRRAFARDLPMHERDVVVLDVTLAPEAPPPVARPANANAGTPAAATAAAPSRVDADHEASVAPARPPGPNRAAAIAATAGALLLAGGGVAAYAVAGAQNDDAFDACRTHPTCDDAKTAVRTWDAVALGAWVGAAALGTAAIVLWATPGSDGGARVTATPQMLRFEGTF